MYRTSTSPDAVRPIASQHLVGERFSLGVAIDPAKYHRAVVLLGSGVDHGVGETAVALLVGDLGGGASTSVALFTDRRMLARSDTSVLSVAYSDIHQAYAVKGMIFDDLNVVVSGRSLKLEGLHDTPRVAGYLHALAQVHPGYRAGLTQPLPQGIEGDPLGLDAARAERANSQARGALLFEAIEGAHRRIQMPAGVAADLVTRAAMLERTVVWGRGAREGWWTSCLNPADLVYAFTRIFGPVQTLRPTGNGWLATFSLKRPGVDAGAVVSTAVGLLALGVFGVGWVSTPGRSLGEITVQCAVGHGSTGFAMLDGNELLWRNWSDVVERVFAQLHALEGRMLLLRALWGWEADLAALDAVPQAALSERMRLVLGA